jgi:uncharacterized membrane protein YhaH (DUF805 family)
MGFVEAVTTCLLKKYADFSGRARRSEYWWFILFLNLVLLVPYIIAKIIPSLIFLLFIVWLAGIVPALGVGTRRFHDIGKSGWFLLLGLIPIVGGLILIYFFVQPSQPESNAYGAPPA